MPYNELIDMRGSVQQWALVLALVEMACGRIGFEGVAADGAAADRDGAPADAVVDGATGPLPSARLVKLSHLGGPGNDLCYSLDMNSSGRHAIAARFSESADLGMGVVVSEGSTDIFHALWSDQDTMISPLPYGDPEAQGGNAVAVDESGLLFATGDFRGSVDFGDGAIDSPGAQSLYAFSLADDTSHAWSLAAGSGQNDFGHDVATDGTGASVVVGRLLGPGELGSTPLAHIGGRDALILQLTSSGDLAWSRTLGGALDDEATCAALLPSGGVIVGGAFQGEVDFGGDTPATAQADAGYVVSLGSAAGAYQWVRVIDGPGTEYVYGMGRDDEGNVYVAGEYMTGASVAGVALPPASGSDAFAASFRQDGTLRWVITAGGSEVDVFHDVAVRNGHAYIVGYFTGTSELFPAAPAPPEWRDGLVVAADAATGELRWKNRMSEVTAVGIGADASGLVAASGYFRSPADFGDGTPVSPRGNNDSAFPELEDPRSNHGEIGKISSASASATTLAQPW